MCVCLCMYSAKYIKCSILGPGWLENGRYSHSFDASASWSSLCSCFLVFWFIWVQFIGG